MSEIQQSKAIARRPAEIAVIPDGVALTALQVRQQVNRIQEIMREVMEDGQHYGKIPGCGDKPALLKAGAEKLGLAFRLIPTFKVERIELGNGHREYAITCLLTFPTGEPAGEGVGSCSTMEKKYRYRDQARKCPRCGKEAIIKGKDEYGGGWLCWRKKEGCGAAFKDGDKAIESQSAGRVENDDIADVYNTVLKMAKKRAHVDAILTATAASDIFTQDIDEQLEDATARREVSRGPIAPPQSDDEAGRLPLPPRVGNITVEQAQANDKLVADWEELLADIADNGNVDDLNELLPRYREVHNHTDRVIRLAADRIWQRIVKCAKGRGWHQDRQTRLYVAPEPQEAVA